MVTVASPSVEILAPRVRNSPMLCMQVSPPLAVIQSISALYRRRQSPDGVLIIRSLER